MLKNGKILGLLMIAMLTTSAVFLLMGKHGWFAQLSFSAFAFAALFSAWLFFRDMADFTQFWLKVSREESMWTWYNRKKILVVSIVSLIAMSAIWFFNREFISLLVFVVTFVVWAVLFFSGYINPKIMMRARQDNGRLVSVAEAKAHVEPNENVVVVAVEGHARAHPDRQVVRPHVAGGESLGGEDVVMTFCGLTNLGIAVTPELNGRRLNLQPMTQLNNNLILVDEEYNEAIQQLWLQTETDLNAGADNKLKQWPTFRMPFGKFALAYPEGQVFLNDYRTADTRSSLFKNPFLAIYDRIADAVFDWSVAKQGQQEEPVFPTLAYSDQRLPTKQKIWGFNVDDDYVAYTEDFVRGEKSPINTRVGGKPIVVAYNEAFESLGIYYNHSGSPVTQIDFYGNTPNGEMPRVETVKAGAYWIVLSHFFKNTDINRIDSNN